MSIIEKLFVSYCYVIICIEIIGDDVVYWLFMYVDVISGVCFCCCKDMLDEMWNYMSVIMCMFVECNSGKLCYFVLVFDVMVYNFGGDLDLFMCLICEGNCDCLFIYVQCCVEGVYYLYIGFGGDVCFIVLIQGDVLGGGLEMVLVCYIIVVEEGSGMGLLEVLFGLFLGMGVYLFLCKWVVLQFVEKIILDGWVYSVEEMYVMGVVDVLVFKGQGVKVVEDLICQYQCILYFYLVMNVVCNFVQVVCYDELLEIIKVWVDFVLVFGDKLLCMMDCLIKVQICCVIFDVV